MILQPPFNDLFQDTLRMCVRNGGGKYLGLQEAMFPDLNPVLTFTHPETGALSAIRINPITFDAMELTKQIRTMIDGQTKKIDERTVRISVKSLKQLSDKLLSLAEEIDALHKEKQ